MSISNPSGSPVKESSLQVPLAELLWGEMLHFQSPLSSVSQESPVNEPPPSRSPMDRDVHFQSLLLHSFWSPKKRSPDETKSQLSLKVPGQGAPQPHFPNRAPMERAALFPQPVIYSFIHTAQIPQLRSSPPK